MNEFNFSGLRRVRAARETRPLRPGTSVGRQLFVATFQQSLQHFQHQCSAVTVAGSLPHGKETTLPHFTMMPVVFLGSPGIFNTY